MEQRRKAYDFSEDGEKIDKIQYPFIMITQNKLGMRRNYLNQLNHNCEISISNIILHGKILSYFACSQKKHKNIPFTSAS